MHYLNVFPKEYFSSDENLTSDDESNTETSDEESIAGNASNTEQNLSSEDETINPNTSTTGEDLIHYHVHVHKLIRYLAYKVQTIKMTQKIQTIKMKQVIKL